MQTQNLDAVKQAVQSRLTEIIPSMDFYVQASPILILLLGGMVTLLAGVFKNHDPEEPSLTSFGIAFVTLTAALVAPLFAPFREATAWLGSGFLADSLSRGSFVAIALGTLVTLIIAYNTENGRKLLKPELCSLLLFSSAGMMIQVSSGEFMSFFAGLEIMSVSLYVLVGYQRKSVYGLEAAVKYFLLGAGAAAVILFGMALIYLHTGSMHWGDLNRLLLEPQKYPLAMVGVVMFLSGIAFKLALVPFHGWAPDVYQGANATLTGYMATLVKFTIAVVFLRILASGLGQSSGVVVGFFWIVGALSIIVGSLFGLVHNSIKRMLAYSSIANAGYFCLAFAALANNPNSVEAKEALFSYATLYIVMNMSVFAVVAWLEDGNREDLLKEELAGLGFKNPLAAVALSIFLLSLAGIPPLAGFIGKFLLLKAALAEGFVGLSVLLVLFSCIGLFYYLSLIVYMWFKPSTRGAVSLVRPESIGMKVIVALGIVAVIATGVFGPRWAINLDYTMAVESPVRTGNIETQDNTQEERFATRDDTEKESRKTW